MSFSPTTSRRGAELGLGLLAAIVAAFGYLLVQLAQKPDVPADLWVIFAAVLGLFTLAHIAVRRLAPDANQVLLPIAALLNGLGFVTVARLDSNLGRIQAAWTAVSILAFVLTLVFVKRVRTLERYRYTFLFLGMIALLLPLAPGLGKTINGARLWVGVGPVNFQPGEAAKVFLVLFFAAYLVDKREVLASGGRRIGRMVLPEPRHLGPLMLAWGVSILIMVRETDLGQAMILFALCGLMLYVATERAAYTVVSVALFLTAAVIAYQLFGHVQTRVQTWIDPFKYANDKGYQLVQSLFGFAAGGFAGTGLGLGSPKQIPNVATDFVFSAIGEELGLLGCVAVLIALLLLIGSGYQIAVRSERPFSKLFATGLTTIIGLQSFVIIGGVTRVIPLTGVTLPFISYGGSSLLANWVILALLLRISDDNAHGTPVGGSQRTARAP
ncbi:MAG TPA: FtsW/RodA/SpoVE family cell cycle protein [Acidimicrobiia bacterium]|nr:FtsW/RodA/SpoVE family cell cycle protein [Acidimicrobiia bacterium]